ncbi:MAG: T9SS type A sorting domain-containing protein [Chitinophagaceae bacterium]|nr:T9SS type A sorting domain-containing protein [Chitinophagaceae bacterium]MCW5906050.1 T9SS type A sorting domain-containing protein [Chitinophagaceae bacterium]
MIKLIIIWLQTAKQCLLLCCCFLLSIIVHAQFSPYNLVPNPSFEQYDNCPIESSNFKNDKPNFWYKPDLRGATYYNACANNNITGVPANFGGGGYNFQYPRTGNGYIAMYYYNSMDSRNYIQVQLLDSLQQGECYYAEYYVNSLNTLRLGCNNQSMLFTNNPVYVDTANNIYLLPANPQIQNPYIVTDTLNWVKVAGVFTAQGGEKYLTLGNFKNNAQTSFQIMQTTGYYGAAYYIDDVSVLPLDSITLKADAGEDKTITAGDSTFIGSFTTGLTNVVWYNSAGNVIATNVSGLFVQPATSTFYVIEQNVCGQYSKDTVYVSVGAVPLRIVNYQLLIINEGVVNKWFTADEINVSHFNIQRSSNGIEFYTINTVAAKNNSYNEYSFTDVQPLNGKSYYRIEAVDKDGKITYSKTLQITLNIKPETLNIYPNPARNVVNVVSKNIQQINIIDFTGRTLIQQNFNNANNVKLNVENVSKGIYLLKVVDVKGNIQTKKLIVE